MNITNSLDIETFTDENRKIIPFCICFLINNKIYTEYYYENNDIIISSIETIFKVMLKNIIHVYIHNINFDGYLILESLTKQKKFKFDALIRENNIYSIAISNYNKKIILKCSYKIIPRSLDSIGETFGISKKLPFPHLFSKKENLFYIGTLPSLDYFNNEQDYYKFIETDELAFNFKEYVIKYCKNDIHITSNFISKVKEILKKYTINLDDIYSAPSLSLKIFTKKYNNNKISFNLKNHKKDLIRHSYFGGRCEVYGNPQKDDYIFHYDFTGMYAQCMKESFPYGESYILDNPSDFSKPGFYYIEYDSQMFIPVLPHKSKINNKLMFTNGKNKGLF